ncbi:MAG: sulfotransferase [Gammaproteobacteria bacterium]
MSPTLDAEALHAEASAATGLADFGTSDYLAGLAKVIEAFDACDRREAIRERLRGLIVRTLCARLHTQAGWNANPDYRAVPIRAPLVVTGMPRTGTTALHHLLSVDPQFQWLPNWLTPAPRPRPPRAQWDSDPQYCAVAAAIEAQHRENPTIRAAHLTAADLPEECIAVMVQSFVSMTFVSSVPIPLYHAWFFNADERPSYRRHADLLRMVGLHAPGKTWLLKNPSHSFGAAALLETFPDARVVVTHRDPVSAITSGASLLAMAGMGWRPEELGPHRLRVWALAMDRLEQVRQRQPDRFHDVDHRRFRADPLAVVRGIYDRFDLQLTADTEAAMRQWVRENPQGAHGEHRYAPEDFGLTAMRVRERLAAYIERHGLESAP